MDKRIKRGIIALAAFGAASTAPVVPYDMKWVQSYETIAFNTPTGDIGEGEYAVFEDGFVAKKGGKLRQFKTLNTAGLKRVNVVGKACYNKFLDEKGNVVRVRTLCNDYRKLINQKNYPQPKMRKYINAITALKTNAAIAYDASSSASDTLVSSISWAHVISGTDVGIVVGVSGSEWDDCNPTNVTIGGSSITSDASIANVSLDLVSEIWYKTAPPTGTQVIAVTLSASCSDVLATAVSVTGADQTDLKDVSATAQDTTSTTNPSITLTTTANTYLYDMMASTQSVSSKLTPDSPQVLIGIFDFGADTGGSSRKDGGSAGTKTMSWTDTDADESWVIAAFAMKEASGGGTPTPEPEPINPRVIFFE